MKAFQKQLLEEMTRRLVEELEPEQIILFGSHVWGTAEEDSDVDLLVIVPTSSSTPIQRARQAYRCMRGIKASKDILVKTRLEVTSERKVHASLVSQILEQGKIIYGASKT